MKKSLSKWGENLNNLSKKLQDEGTHFYYCPLELEKIPHITMIVTSEMK